MLKNNFLNGIYNIKYEDIKIEMISIFEAFSIGRYLQSFSNTLILIGQIYYFSNSENFEIQLFVYVISWISLRLLFSFISYFQLLISQEISQLFLDNKYHEIGDLFNRAVMVCECFNLVFYFPFKILLQMLLGLFIFDREGITTILTISREVCEEKISTFLSLHFAVLLMNSINSPLGDIMLTFQMKSIININSILRVVINNTFCWYLSKNKVNTYFLSGIGYANILTDSFTLVFLVLAQHIKNPYPQSWLQFNSKLFSLNTFTSILNKIDVASTLSFVLFYFWDDFFLLIYSSIYLDKDSMETCTILFALMIFKRLFFHIRRKDKEEIISYYHGMQPNNSSPMFNELNYEYDDPSQSLKGDYQWMLFLKTKVTGTIVINFIIGIIYVLFYFFGGFQIINQSIDGWWYIVPFFSFNALIEQCTYQAKAIREYLLKKNSLMLVLVAFVISLICFVFVNLIMRDCFTLLIASIYLGYYFLLYSFYPEIRDVDMRIVNLEFLIHSNSDLDNTPLI